MAALKIDEKIGVPFVFAWVAWVSIQFLFPASYWFDVRGVDVHDADNWVVAEVDYDRIIKRNADIKWKGKVMRRVSGGWTAHSTTPWREEPYFTYSQLPVPVTLQWLLWTEESAYMLPCGEYKVIITWVVNPDSWLWERRVTRDDTFILGDGSCV